MTKQITPFIKRPTVTPRLQTPDALISLQVGERTILKNQATKREIVAVIQIMNTSSTFAFKNELAFLLCYPIISILFAIIVDTDKWKTRENNTVIGLRFILPLQIPECFQRKFREVFLVKWVAAIDNSRRKSARLTMFHAITLWPLFQKYIGIITFHLATILPALQTSLLIWVMRKRIGNRQFRWQPLRVLYHLQWIAKWK